MFSLKMDDAHWPKYRERKKHHSLLRFVHPSFSLFSHEIIFLNKITRTEPLNCSKLIHVIIWEGPLRVFRILEPSISIIKNLKYQGQEICQNAYKSEMISVYLKLMASYSSGRFF